ncbi:MAG: hypothetical protein R3261_11550 [Alphaproteobacteria bacterium]|nr:hypothetical protein [Alphaproteobacteria bacterium]
MKNKLQLQARSLSAPKLALLATGMVVLAACNQTTAQAPSEGIDYRQARFEEIAAMREYRGCVDEAYKLDQQARENKSAGQYIASAKLLQKCESGLGPEVAGINTEERMRAYGLSIQNYLKGGDVTAAQKSLDQFETAFDGSDLYYADGSSFTQTMGALLGQVEDSAYGRFSMLNVSKDVKQEMRRKQ